MNSIGDDRNRTGDDASNYFYGDEDKSNNNNDGKFSEVVFVVGFERREVEFLYGSEIATSAHGSNYLFV